MDLSGLDLQINRAGEAGYRCSLTLWRGKAETGYGAYAIPGSFDPLWRITGLPGDYTRRLVEIFYARAELGRVLCWCLDALRAQGQPGESAALPDRRLHLCLEPFNSPLQQLLWELLSDPDGGMPFSTRPDLVFSRLVPAASADPGPVRPRLDPRASLRGLLAAPNPGNLSRLGLAPVRWRDELALSGLTGIAYDVFPTPPGQRGTLADLARQLYFEAGVRPYDLLYLACHARLEGRQPRLFFEDPYGGTQALTGDELVNQLAPLCPRLVALAAPLETDSSTGEGLLVLGLKLARAGVPAVLVLPGSLPPDLRPGFMQQLLQALTHTGQADLAVTRARQAILATGVAWWQPVLMVSRRDGRVWEDPPGAAGVAEKVIPIPPALTSQAAAQ